YKGVESGALTRCGGNPLITPATGIEDSAALGPRGTEPGKGNSVEAIADGASNTLLMTEIAGRGLAVYIERQLVAPIGSTVTFVPTVGDPLHYVRGTWADYNGTPKLRGYAVVGGPQVNETGCRMVNVTNHDSPYSFHAGVANVLRCDGSVGFLRPNVFAPVQL